MRIPKQVKSILKQKITHQDKIVLLQQLLDKEPKSIIIKDFVRAEELLIKKNGMLAAEVYADISLKTCEPRWLIERQAKTYAKYAYYDIGSGPLNKSFEIYTTKLNVSPEKAWKKIADILKTVKGYGYAAQCYANAGMSDAAGKMLAKQNDPQRAAWYFEQAEQWVKAAAKYKKAKLPDKAGTCYEKAGHMKQAVQQWKKAGTLEQHNIGKQTYQNIMSK